MKIAASCFGCLAFIFFGIALVAYFGFAAIMAFMPPEAVSMLAPLQSTFYSGSSFCCCMSGVLAIVLLAVGSMSKKGEEYE